MKKLIFLLVFGLIAVFVQAQTPNGTPTSFAGATVTNSQTVYLAVTAPKVISANYAVNLTVISVNGTGTPTVTAKPQGSLNNSVWFDLQTSADTVNNAGTVAKKFYNYSDAYWRYYRIALTGTNTGVTTVSGSLVIKK